MNSFFQVERKRHIGNDIVNIIFLDGSPEDAAKFQACSIALALPGLSESVMRGRALCFEWGFMRTFTGNQDVAVK